MNIVRESLDKRMTMMQENLLHGCFECLFEHRGRIASIACCIVSLVASCHRISSPAFLCRRVKLLKIACNPLAPSCLFCHRNVCAFTLADETLPHRTRCARHEGKSARPTSIVGSRVASSSAIFLLRVGTASKRATRASAPPALSMEHQEHARDGTCAKGPAPRANTRYRSRSFGEPRSQCSSNCEGYRRDSPGNSPNSSRCARTPGRH